MVTASNEVGFRTRVLASWLAQLFETIRRAALRSASVMYNAECVPSDSPTHQLVLPYCYDAQVHDQAIGIVLIDESH